MKINPIEKAILDQTLVSTKIYVKQFQKTPSIELAKLVNDKCKDLQLKMNKYIRNFEKESKFELKINGEQ